MKRIVACLVVLVSALVAPPARGQTAIGWRTKDVRVGESVGEVEVRFTWNGPGRFTYYTKNGACHGYPTAEDPANRTPLSPDECGSPYARAGEDYVAVRGEWTFTEAGSRTVRIPIIDDDLDETDLEAFTIYADEVDGLSTTDSTTDGAYETRGSNAEVRIRDDDPKEDGDAPPPVPRAEQRPTGSLAVDTAAAPDGSNTASAPVPASGAPVPTTVAPPPDLEVALPSGELEPGPGFELVSERDPKPAPERDDRSGGSAAWWPLAFGATAVGSGGVVWLRRLRRWSTTRS